MFTLYITPGTSSMAPHIALHEIGVPFERVALSFARKENRTPEYLAINAYGKVPTLLIDKQPLTEVAAILFYLAKRFPEARLLPRNDTDSEAHAISWMSFVASTLHGARRQGPEHTNRVFAIADARLGTNEWAIGSYSIADIHLFRLFWRLRFLGHAASGRFPNLCAHYDRMMLRPAVQRTCEVEATIGYEPVIER